MPKTCSERSNDILIAELQRMTREAVEFLTAKRLELLKRKKKLELKKVS